MSLLSIGELEGNTTVISHYDRRHVIVGTGTSAVSVSTGAGPHITLHEKVFCVLDFGGINLSKPVHAQSFSPRHLSALTLNLRTYDQWTNTFVPYSGSRVGLWFKLTTDDC